MEDLTVNSNNIYIIKHRLSELKRFSNGCFEYYVSPFTVKIHTNRIQDTHSGSVLGWNHLFDDCITKYDIVDVQLYETKNRIALNVNNKAEETFIYLEKDIRFKNYEPIKYSDISGYSTGDSMPILKLCELIKYLNRLSQLTIFM